MRVTLNSDAKLVREIRAQIKKNGGHCACVVEFNDDNRCPCKEFQEQIANQTPGFCHCGLYQVEVEDSDE